MYGITRNTFEGGLNTDTDKSLLDPRSYTDAHNIERLSNGKFKAFTNVQGTLNLYDLTNVSNTKVLGVFRNKYLISGTYRDCLTIFTAVSGGNFKIWCYDVSADVHYELFQEATPSGYLTNSIREISARGYAENNIDHIYFDDGFNETRYFRCEIPSPYTANFLTETDISLQRRGANGKITLDSILTGGALLSGAYQYAYRMVDPVNKKFTKWSALSLPIHVYSAANSSEPVFSDYGLPTTFKIRLDITPTTVELNTFDYFQVAVVENVYPTGPESITEGNTTTFVASLLPIQATSTYLASGVLQNYEHKTNAKVGVVPIEELVVNLAPIKSLRSIAIKQNRLIGANVAYHDLTWDHPSGEPTFTGGSILTRVTNLGDLFSSHEESIYRGYFRDEVYRFGIVYFDKYGNESPVKVLNMSVVTGNQITAGLIDMKFPSRSTSNAYTIFDNNGSPDRIRSLGVHLDNIKNHPTWAVGFRIVRVKRKKKILAQTPLIPMTYVQGIGALDNYPSIGVTATQTTPIFGTDLLTTNEYTDAQPQSTTKVFMPKNLFWPEARVVSRATSINSSGDTTGKIGEARIVRSSEAISLGMIFPQNFMYDDGTFSLDGSEKLQTIDYAALRLNATEYSTGTAGDKLNTKIKGTFFALDAGDYYFDPAWAAKSISEALVPIKGYLTFKNLANSDSLNGKKVMDYASLETEGVDYGFKPQIQKCVVVDAPPTGSENHEIMGIKTLVFAGPGSTAAVSGGVALFSGTAGLTYEGNSSITNKYVTEYSNYSNSYVQAIKIVNIVNNYGDDRYGDADTEYEFISTGASYSFSTSELTTVQAGGLLEIDIDVWGGDCFVAPHTFKVSDGAYSVVNQTKWNSPAVSDSSTTLINKWSKYFLNTSSAPISLPVGVEGAAQYVMVVLESEYNGGVMAQDLLESGGTSFNGIPRLTSSGGEESLKAPLTYRYNLNLSKQNDQKVYKPRPTYNFEKTSFPARLVWSDQKIYNTDQIGFDVFRVLNFLDLQEKGGEITGLALQKDNLYAIQERAVTMLPVGETQLTTTDAGTLAVGTSDFFGRPIEIDTEKGCQHPRTVVETGEVVYFADSTNRAVYELSNRTLKNIAFNNQTLLRTKLNLSSSTIGVVGIYDPVRKQYWLSNNIAPYCYIFDEKDQQWSHNLEFPTDGLYGGVSISSGLVLMGKVGSQISIYAMYQGQANNLFGTVVTPRVTFVVNPEDGISKVFTNQMYVATERLATADFTVEREQELADQTVTGTVIAVSPVEGNYRIELPRAAGDERLRGLRMLVTIKWKTDNFFSTLSEVFTKYRLLRRLPF